MAKPVTFDPLLLGKKTFSQKPFHIPRTEARHIVTRRKAGVQLDTKKWDINGKVTNYVYHRKEI